MLGAGSSTRVEHGRDEPLVVELDSPSARFETCGGKGVNLARLVQAGFRVPTGFVVTTEAYRRFVETHQLSSLIEGALTGLDPGDAQAIEAASSQIRDGFTSKEVPEEIAEAIRAARAESLGDDVPVAVRSSATAEDLPNLSFAGQQDTFLNVIGEPEILRATVLCWASLWTARAIGYRLRNNIPQQGLALAVVVQAMVPAEVSGVMFTANPVTGVRDEVVIDATWGLGEELVSGLVEPDNFIVPRSGQVTRRLGAKSVATVPVEGGGITTRGRSESGHSSITDAQARELAELGRAVAAEFGGPQDIEWSIADGVIQVLQSRAITSLFPVPGRDPGALWFSFGAVQGMLQPMTPLGRDTWTQMLSGVSALTGRRFSLEDVGYLLPAGERLWIRIDWLLRSPLGHQVMPRALPMLEPSVAAIVSELTDEYPTRRLGLRDRASLLVLARILTRVLPRLPGVIVKPTARREAFQRHAAAFADDTEQRMAQSDGVADPWDRLAARLEIMGEVLDGCLPMGLKWFLPILGPVMTTLYLLNKQAGTLGDRGQALLMETLRGLPGNVTTQMDLVLWQAAQTIQKDSASHDAFTTLDAQTLSERYAQVDLPPVAQKAVAAFMKQYGMRGVAEIDLGKPRWRDNPVDVARTLQSYLQITDPEQAPDAVFRRGAAAAERATEELAALLGKPRRIRFLVDRVRQLLGARETPKFVMVRLLGMMRQYLLESGADLVKLGVFGQPDDIFFLHLDELKRLPSEPSSPWRQLVSARREVAQREQLRGQVPRLISGDGHAYHEGLSHGDGGLGGSPVSPGVAEGPVRVIFDPQATQLLPGEILVCPGTDPAWTPLFLAAGGLVTEVGGMMTHGSVVAREYGIPAVVGVHQATTRLHTGQRVRIDGTTGTLEILD